MRMGDNDEWSIRMDFQVLEARGKFWITLTWCPECGSYVHDPETCLDCGYHFVPVQNAFESKAKAMAICTWLSMCEMQLRIVKEKGEA